MEEEPLLQPISWSRVLCCINIEYSSGMQLKAAKEKERERLGEILSQEDSHFSGVPVEWSDFEVITKSGNKEGRDSGTWEQL